MVKLNNRLSYINDASAHWLGGCCMCACLAAKIMWTNAM